MALVRWNPFRDMDAMQREMNRLFEEWPRRYERGEKDLSTFAWSPNVDIFEDDGKIQINVEVPGVEEKDVKLGLENGILTISGERKLENEKKMDNYHRLECSYGAFSRSFSLPTQVDQEKVAAKLDKGILRVSLPKREESKPKKIEIKVEN